MVGIGEKVRIGVSGTGYIARGLATLLLARNDQFEITTILTRRPVEQIHNFAGDALVTNDVDAMVDRCDLIVECSGSVGGAARVALATTKAKKPLVTLNAEFQLTLGAAFSHTGLVTEAQGDQPGSLAALNEEVISMGFSPLVYGSQKGFLNRNPQRADMEYWAHRQGISVSSTVSFTDGTKVNIEQALVANALGIRLGQEGLIGPTASNLREGGELLGQTAQKLGYPIADYVMVPGGRGEIFIVATHQSPQQELSYYKLGDGPYYLIDRPFHLGHFEVPMTIERVLAGKPPLLTAGSEQKYSVAAIAKHDIQAGSRIERAIGSYQFYGVAVDAVSSPSHVPIGLIENATLRNSVQTGQTITWSDIDLSDDLALDIAADLYASSAVGLAV